MLGALYFFVARLVLPNEVCLDSTLPYSLLRLRSWVENQILNLGQSSWWYHSGPTLRWLYSYTMLFYILTLEPWSGCPLSGKFYPRSSLLLIQISVSPSLTNAMSRPVHICVFYFQSSHHSYEMILFTFLFPCWIPLSYQNVSPTRAGTCLINPASLGPKTVPGPLKHSAFFFFFFGCISG